MYNVSAANVIRRYDDAGVATAALLLLPYDELAGYKAERGVFLIVARKYPIHPPGILKRDKTRVSRYRAPKSDNVSAIEASVNANNRGREKYRTAVRS